MARSFNAKRDAYTAYSEHGPATVNVGVSVATALAGPIVPHPPAFPPGYRPREADITALKSLLISGDKNIGIVGRSHVSGLRGMGGLGKTVLTIALVHDSEVRKAFSYGIVWLNFGREAKALTQLTALGRAVTGRRLDYVHVEEARIDLARILGERRLLIVLDDIWHATQIAGFRDLPVSCHLLITTRDQAVLDRSSARTYSVGLLDPPASRALFIEVFESADLPNEAASVIAACAGLPLALAAAAAMARRRGWVHTQNAFRRGRLDALKARWLPDTEQENLAVVLAASVEALPDRERACFLECAIWPEDVQIPASALDLYWSVHAPDPFDQEEIAGALVDASVLQRDTNGTVRLHDLYHEYLRHRAGHALAAMHGAIADRCVCVTESGCELIDTSDWTLVHLPWHLAKAERPAQVKALLLDYGWLALKLAAHSVQALITDTQLVADSELQQLRQVLLLSAYVLTRDPNQLAAQLIGRLHDPPDASMMRLVADATISLPADVLVPRGGKHLTAPGALVATLAGHTDRLTGALLLPDGCRVLSWSDDRTLRLWDPDSGAELRRFEGHTDRLTGALLLPDGRRVLSWSDDRTLRLWDLDSGAELRRFEGHTDRLTGALLLPDGRRAIFRSDDHTLRLWDLDTGTALAFEGHTDTVTGALLLPDGHRVLSWSTDRTLRLWDLDTGTALAFEGHTDTVTGALLLPDGHRVLSWSTDRTLRLWDLDTGTALAFEGHTDTVTGALLLPDGHRVLSWSTDRTLRLWDLDSGAELRRFEGHDRQAFGALLLPDGRRALSWADDCTLRLWDLDSGAELRRFEGHNHWIVQVLLLSDGRALSLSLPAAFHENTLRLWDLDTGTARSLEGHTGLTDVLLLPDGRVLSWSDDRTLRLWDFDSAPARTFEGHDRSVTGALLLPDGHRVLSWSTDRTLRLWDLDTGTALAFEGHTDTVTGALLLPDGRRALSWSTDRTLRLWDLDSGTALAFEGHTDTITGALLLPDGHRVLSWSIGPSLWLWDADSGAELRRFEGHTGWVIGALLLPDGRRALSWADDHTLRLWDLYTGTALAFEGHTDTVTGALLLPDGRVLSWADDRTLRLWDLDSGAELRRFEGHEYRVIDALLLPDGRCVIFRSDDYTLRLWDLADQRELKRYLGDGYISMAILPREGKLLLAGDTHGRVLFFDLPY